MFRSSPLRADPFGPWGCGIAKRNTQCPTHSSSDFRWSHRSTQLLATGEREELTCWGGSVWDTPCRPKVVSEWRSRNPILVKLRRQRCKRAGSIYSQHCAVRHDVPSFDNCISSLPASSSSAPLG